MSLTFRQVMPAVQATLTNAAWADLEFTVLRDVSGKVRVLVESVLPKRPTPKEQGDIEAALRAAIGGWLGGATPVWGPQASEQAAVVRLLQTIRRTRRKTTNPAVHLVERHAGREAWTGQSAHAPPWPIGDVDAGTAPPILTFFSHKGGVGRTTDLVAVGLGLARQRRHVLLVDLDLEAPGLGTVLPGAPGSEGVIDLLLMEAPSPADIQAFTTSVADPALIDAGVPLRVLHAGEVDPDYIEMLARLDQSAGADRPGVAQRLAKLFTVIRVAYPGLDYILVDARAGFHDLGGIMLASLSHGAVVVGTSSAQSWLGLEVVARLLANPYRGGAAEPVPLIVVHGLAPEPGASDEKVEIAAFKQRLYDCLTNVYYPAAGLPPQNEEGGAHDALPIPWTGALRGRGGPLNEQTTRTLGQQQFTALLDRVTTIFPRPGVA